MLEIVVIIIFITVFNLFSLKYHLFSAFNSSAMVLGAGKMEIR